MIIGWRNYLGFFFFGCFEFEDEILEGSDFGRFLNWFGFYWRIFW